MLTPGIHGAYERASSDCWARRGVTHVARGAEAQARNCGRGALFCVAGGDLPRATRSCTDEVFGAIVAASCAAAT